MRSLTTFVLSLLLSLSLAPALYAQDAEEQKDDPGRALANRVTVASNIKAWDEVSHFTFTWRVFTGSKKPPFYKDRGYVWEVRKGIVKVTIDETTTKVPVAGWGPDAKPSAKELAAHRAWVNDSFWALFGLKLAWDDVAGFDDLGKVDVPQLPKLGKRRALRVRYGKTGGYTPGDHYVLYLGDDDLPLAWAFHKAGAKDPKLVTTREVYRQIGGFKVATQFKRPDGTLLIAIEGLAVGQAKKLPASRPASRPAKKG